MSRILIIGSEGQLGSELSNFLKDKKDTNSIVLSDIKENSSSSLKYVQLDAMNYSELEKLLKILRYLRYIILLQFYLLEEKKIQC